MTNLDNGEFNYTINSSLTTKLGQYDWVAFCCDGTDCAVGYGNFEITSTGNPTPDGMPMFQMGLIIVIFGIACFLLFLSSQMNEVALKIFFLIASLVFLMATMLTAYMVSTDGNVATAINTTTLGLITVLGTILFIVFAYILIRQTINALDMFKAKRGLVWDGGYNSKRAY